VLFHISFTRSIPSRRYASLHCMFVRCVYLCLPHFHIVRLYANARFVTIDQGGGDTPDFGSKWLNRLFSMFSLSTAECAGGDAARNMYIQRLTRWTFFKGYIRCCYRCFSTFSTHNHPKAKHRCSVANAAKTEVRSRLDALRGARHRSAPVTSM
jgi:hypothetical protein